MKKIEKMLHEYHDIAAQAKLLKDKENNLRKLICAELLAGKEAGTHKFVFGDMSVKAVKKFNYNLDQDLIKELLEDDVLMPEEKDCISVKYSVKMGVYNQLDRDAFSLLEQAITSTEAMPTLEVIYGGGD